MKQGIINRVFNALWRPAPEPTGTLGDTRYLGQTVSVRIPDENEVRPLESAVIDVMASLVSLVRFETDLEILKRPDRTMSLKAWLRQLAWHASIDGIFSIVVVEDSGEDLEYVIFQDSVKPTKMAATDTVYQYSRNDQVFYAPERNILQFRYRYQHTTNLQTLRQAEDSFWARYKRIGENVGIVTDLPTQPGMPGGRVASMPSEEQTLIIREFMRRIKDSSVARIPSGQQFTELTKSSEDIEKAFEGIMRAWCYNYRVPTALLYLDLPSHSRESVSATYGHFLRQCVKPLLEDIVEALKERTGAKIKVDYSGIEKGSVIENADQIIKLSQTGVLTINEIREMEGFPPRSDGDIYPNAAGAPQTEESEEGSEEDGSNTANLRRF